MRESPAPSEVLKVFHDNPGKTFRLRELVVELGLRSSQARGYLVHHGAANVEARDGRLRFVIEQGDFMNRPSRINIEVTGKLGSIDEVRVGGPSVVVARGEVFF